MQRIRIGITGQGGFIGTHLKNTISIRDNQFEIVPFNKCYFKDQKKLDSFVISCDVVVHLAAINRHLDDEILYHTNIHLVKVLVDSLERTKSTPQVIISSSSQEERDNLYGKSKKVGREILSEWASKSGGKSVGLIIPNVFGPFGKPNYNSFIATFCDKIVNGDSPSIDNDAEVPLIYVGDLVSKIIDCIEDGRNADSIVIEATTVIKVSDVLTKLLEYKDLYFDKGTIPNLTSTFDIQLFNTFRSFIPLGSYFPRRFRTHSDERGSFTELIKLGVGGQISFSTTHPGYTRGNHYHTRKIERFSVIRGKALIQMRRVGTDVIEEFYLDGNEASYVDMPIWFAHNIQNIGEEDLYTVFWINEFYDPKDPDTYMENVLIS